MKFSKKSILKKYIGKKYKFCFGFGYYIPSTITNTIASKISTLINQPELSYSIIPHKTITKEHKKIIKLKKRNVLKYFKSCVEKIYYQRHSIFNITDEKKKDLDNFLMSVELSLESNIYSFLVKRSNVENENYFERLPFQQLMMLDSISTMINKSNLLEYKDEIFFHIKKLLGYNWLNIYTSNNLSRLLSRQVVGYNIKRRMGKSVAVYTELARILCFYPNANIKALYTVHTASAATECYSRVAEVIQKFIELFNRKQKQKFKNEKLHYSNFNNYYFIANYEIIVKLSTINIYFHKIIDNKSNNNEEIYFSKNSLLCKGYTQKNVSIF